MKIVKMNWFFKMFGITGICLAPFMIQIKEGYFTDRRINHEKIHWKQQWEMLIIPFYLWYFIEWIVRIFINGKQAYMKLLFEQEAYNNDDNLNYLKTRKHFAWF